MTGLYKKIDEKAQNMLVRADAFAQPVDLHRILEKLKLGLKPAPMEEEYSGFLAVDERVIVINQRHAKTRQRFTIAHEIGHYHLHRNNQTANNVFIDRAVYFRSDREVYFRDNQFGEADHRMEMEANAYAAGLLMPQKLLDQYIDQHADDIDLSKAAGIRMLADEFEVSRAAMEYRLQNLGFILRTSF